MESTVINQEHPNNGGEHHHHHSGGDLQQQQQQPPTHEHMEQQDHQHPRPDDPNGQYFQQQRRNPYFFDMDDPHDFFTNPALRSRLSRFHNPFNSMFGQRKRRTSPQSHEPAAADMNPAYDPHERFFSQHFGPHWNDDPWANHQNLNGSRKRAQQPQQKLHNNDFDYIPAGFRQYIPEEFGFSHRPPQHHHAQVPPQNQQQYTQRTNSGDLRRPQFCDAAMQTDDDLPSTPDPQHPLGQQPSSPDPSHNQGTEQRGPRAQSVPTENSENPKMGFKNTADAYASTSPNGSFASAHAHADSDLRKGRSNSNTMGNVRRVPIIIEGKPSSLPKESPLSQHHQNQSHSVPPPPQAQPQSGPPPPQDKPVEPPSPSIISINKIQEIQQDVLDLMFKVDQFQGNSRDDKDYKYLDEMLTRNLLKLDTIDTRGNDSIRLARKEAIKCIQASINVLEAKADGRAPVQAEEEKKVEESEQEPVQEPTSNPESQPKEQKPDENTNPNEENQEVDKSKIPIPLPGIPSHQPDVPEPTIRDCVSDEEDTPVVTIKAPKKKSQVQTPV